MPAEDVSRDSPQTCPCRPWLGTVPRRGLRDVSGGRGSRGNVPEVRSFVAAAMGVLCVIVLASAAVPPKAQPQLTVWQQVQRQCRHLARERLDPYPWPLAPFHRQHPVRGNFGDPRTVLSGPGEGAFSFHNGVDISAWPGNHVYPVVSGRVVRVTGDLVAVATHDHRRFQYVHIAPRVSVGDEVVAQQTLLGTVRPRWNHVHLAEFRSNCAVNQLARSHLTPYRDATRPTVRAIFVVSPSWRELPASAVGGRVRILADAFDTPALPSPRPWAELPVAPAHVAWRLETAAGEVVAHNTAADFRYGEPPRKDFCSVYAPGTRQNFAAVDGRFHWGEPGRYLFDLTPKTIDTSRLPPGRYRITVVASDTAGNVGTLIRTVILRRGGTAPAVADTRCNPN